MEQQESTTSGVDKATSGAEENKAQDLTSGESEGLAKTLEKALNEKKNAMTKVREMEAQLKKLQEDKLVASQQWKELAEQRERELSETKAALEAKEQKIKEASINGAIRNELLKFGMNPGLIDYALRIIDRKQVQTDPETGVVLGADVAVKEFHKTFAGQSFFVNPSPQAGHTAPDLSSKLSPNDAYKAELRKAKNQKELESVLKKYGKIN